MSQCATELHCLIFTYSRAKTATDASRAADFFHRWTLILVSTLNKYMLAFRNKLDQAARACFYAQSASNASGAVYRSHAVINIDCFLRTDCRAASESKASIITICHRNAGQCSSPAILFTDILTLIMSHITGALASDKGYLPVHLSGGNAHDPADLLRNRTPAHRASVYRGFPSHDGSAQCVASGITTGAAIVSGKLRTYIRFSGIHFHMELLLCNNKAGAHHNSDYGNHNHSYQYGHD